MSDDTNAPPVAEDEDAPVSVADKPREPTEYERQLRRESAKYRRQARDAQEALERQLSEARTAADARVAEAMAKANERIIRTELKSYAVKAGIVDLDGLRLADLSGVKLNDAGEVEGADALIESLKASKPYLFAQTGAQAGNTSNTASAPPPAKAPVAKHPRDMTRKSGSPPAGHLASTVNMRRHRDDLTAAEVRSLLDYDPDTGVFTWRIRPGTTPAECTFNARNGGKIAGAINGDGYRCISVHDRSYRATRLAWLYVTGEWPALEIDHEDGDVANDRFANLRLADRQQQQRNRGSFRGVLKGTKRTPYGRYQAQIGVDYARGPMPPGDRSRE